MNILSNKLFKYALVCASVFAISCNDEVVPDVTSDTEVTVETPLFLQFPSHEGYNFNRVGSVTVLGFRPDLSKAVSDYSELANNPSKFAIYVRVSSLSFSENPELNKAYTLWDGSWDLPQIDVDIPAGSPSNIDVILVDRCEISSSYFSSSYLSSNPELIGKEVRRVWKGTYKKYNVPQGPSDVAAPTDFSLDMKLEKTTDCAGSDFVSLVQNFL